MLNVKIFLNSCRDRYQSFTVKNVKTAVNWFCQSEKKKLIRIVFLSDGEFYFYCWDSLEPVDNGPISTQLKFEGSVNAETSNI